MTVRESILYAFVAAAIGASALALANPEPSPANEGIEFSEPSPPPTLSNTVGATDEFGFDPTRYVVHDGVVRRNETLSDILGRYGVTAYQISQIADQSQGSFDVRRIQAGRPYHVYVHGDSSDVVAGLVYEPSSFDYVVFDLDVPGVEVWKRPILVRRRTVRGTIQSSLYETLQDVGADVELAFELAEIFAWQIDFHHLLPGDHFTAIYDRRFVNGKSAGVGTVHAARFVSHSRDFTAFHFDRQGDIAYFDDEGNSLRKTFLAAPVKYSRISSRYSGRRFHPVLKRYRSHLGTDYAAPRGTPIRATGDGQITAATYARGNGRYVKIRHNGTYTTAYLHMSKIAAGISPGKHVRQGDVIGYVGSTGLARGEHVCYRFWKHGQQVDPLKESFPSAEPVSEQNRPAFAAALDDLMAKLDAVAIEASLPSYALLLK